MVCVLLIVIASVQASAGNNPAVKVAVHVLPHGQVSCASMPEISDCSDINHTYAGCGDIDVFPVFWGMTEYKAFEYSLIWPAEWGTCTFTSCSDLTIYQLDFYGDPETIDPGDLFSHAYFDCHPGDYVEIPGFGWLDASTPGRVCVDGAPPWTWPSPGSPLPAVLDCNQTVDQTICSFCAGVCGIPGHDVCELPSSVEVIQWGRIKAIFR